MKERATSLLARSARALAAAALLAALGAAPALAFAEEGGGPSPAPSQQPVGVQQSSSSQQTQGTQGQPESETDETEQVHVDEAQGDVVKVDIARLVTGDIDLNGETVTFSGEVVGVPIVADSGHTWLQVDDGGLGIAVFMRGSLADKVVYYGGYDITGDTVAITGIYHFDCAAHQGDLDVHAVDLEVTKSGAPINRPDDLSGLAPAILLVVVGGVAGIVYWRLRERMR